MRTEEMAEWNKKQGIQAFTLAELLIVVAIIAVLVAVSIPMFRNKVKNAEKTVCETNRKMLVRQIQVERLDHEDLSKADAETLLQKSDAYCPAGGKYSVIWDDLYIKINCDIHGSSTGGMEDLRVTDVFVEDYKKFVVDFLKENPQKSNDDIRKAFLEKYNGKWPSLIVDGKSYSIQPFYQSKDKTRPVEECVWLFARVNASAAAGWNASYVCVDGVWYGATHYNGTPGDTANVEYKDIDALKAAIKNNKHSNGNQQWVEVTDYKESK